MWLLSSVITYWRLSVSFCNWVFKSQMVFSLCSFNFWACCNCWANFIWFSCTCYVFWCCLSVISAIAEVINSFSFSRFLSSCEIDTFEIMDISSSESLPEELFEIIWLPSSSYMLPCDRVWDKYLFCYATPVFTWPRKTFLKFFRLFFIVRMSPFSSVLSLIKVLIYCSCKPMSSSSFYIFWSFWETWNFNSSTSSWSFWCYVFDCSSHRKFISYSSWTLWVSPAAICSFNVYIYFCSSSFSICKSEALDRWLATSCWCCYAWVASIMLSCWICSSYGWISLSF